MNLKTNETPLFDAGKAQAVKYYLAKYGIVLAFLALCAALAFVSPYFLTANNLLNVLRQTSINGILALGMTFVILTRGIDLSVGSVVACAAMVAASFATGTENSAVLMPVLAGLGVGLILGAVNGVMIARFAIPPFVVTLGMLSMARGLTYIYNDGMPISNLNPAFRFIGQGVVFGIPMPVILFLTVFLICWAVLRFTTFGRYVYAVGGNPKAARTSGIQVRTMTFSVYAISGLLAGLAGLILSGRTSAALPQAGGAYELDAIAAVVIGGTSLAGGVGSVVGTLFGALIIGVLNNGLDLLGVSSFYQQVVKGAIIILAVMLDRSRLTRD
ncbi:ABC transporter permease [Photobacterium sp. GJ3]|uniref:ABC transporter permease n=1 Tax=Photobacterium sp. GJ3 TaxID=2829502 RepID=UPI001B8B6074|nr:ABC transporter permease [Photobacterium sp. GJ3]QUJ67849.1 ABC transporter permease [Photobacterium sp. GJ3]